MTPMTKSLVSLVALALSGFIFALGSAFGSPPETFDVRGHVIHETTQRGVPGLTVRLTPPRLSRKPEQITMTDADGAFSFQNIERGAYLIEVLQALQPLYRQPLELKNNLQLDIELRSKEALASPPPAAPPPPPLP